MDAEINSSSFEDYQAANRHETLPTSVASIDVLRVDLKWQRLQVTRGQLQMSNQWNNQHENVLEKIPGPGRREAARPRPPRRF